MKPKEMNRATALATKLTAYEQALGKLPGLAGPGRADVLVAQIVDSLRRIEFAHYLRDGAHAPARMDPSSSLFDPLRAAVLHHRKGKLDEAWWLVFLGTHFGKHSEDGWRLVRDVYGRLDQGGVWNWSAVSSNPIAFRQWLAANMATLRGADGTTRRFSNHRQYESLKHTGQTFSSYVGWIAPPKTPSDLVRSIHQDHGQNPHAVFDQLYKSSSQIYRFGRLGKFDFLTMLGKLGMAPVEPGSPYLAGATGPLRGARLLFGGSTQSKLPPKILDEKASELGQYLAIGSQALEDSLCNWQKSPEKYVLFRG